MVKFVAVSGTHSSGKSTLVTDCRDLLQSRGSVVDVLSEVPRRVVTSLAQPDWLQVRNNALWKQIYLLFVQASQELIAVRASKADWVLLDRSVVDHLAYTLVLYADILGSAELDEIRGQIARHVEVYDFVALVDPLGLMLDGVRDDDPAFQARMHESIEELWDTLERPSDFRVPPLPALERAHALVSALHG